MCFVYLVPHAARIKYLDDVDATKGCVNLNNKKKTAKKHIYYKGYKDAANLKNK